MITPVLFDVAGSPSQSPSGVDLSTTWFVGPVDITRKEESELSLCKEVGAPPSEEKRRQQQTERMNPDHKGDSNGIIKGWSEILFTRDVRVR
jgi:hypothetical protein